MNHIEKNSRIITLEYVLVPGLNDMPSDAEDLARIARMLKAKINLIPYSQIQGLDFNVPTKDALEAFLGRVRQRHEHITLRQSRGRDIQAACGQLALKNEI
jgi:23S rRNA (adenine2503-C2)-methyltransferase